MLAHDPVCLQLATMNDTAVDVNGLSHRYVRRERTLFVLRDVNLLMEKGSYVSLVGSSGSGKSTLLSLLGGLERPQSGKLVVAGANLASLNGDELAHFRRTVIGFVFQHFGLLEALTALENVELALMLNGIGHSVRTRRAMRLLGDVGLGDRTSHRPHELSGGERQRVAIARAIANEPLLILADEPTGNLDGEAAASVAQLLSSLRRERGCTLLVVTHNPAIAAHADRHFALVDGHLTPVGSTAGEETGG
jgi:putative ABC transport system ATP-binding protein